jgi:ferritin-like protein
MQAKGFSLGHPVGPRGTRRVVAVASVRSEACDVRQYSRLCYGIAAASTPSDTGNRREKLQWKCNNSDYWLSKCVTAHVCAIKLAARS